MFKSIVLFGVITIAAAHPGLIGAGIGGLGLGGGHVASAIAVPTAVSQQSRTDIINPIAARVTSVAHAVPVVAAAPVAVPAAISVGHGLGGIGLGGAGLGGIGLGGVGVGGLGLGGIGGLGHGW